MNLPFHIARRYLFAKKSHNAINVISIISICGIAIATLAMVCTLSVFNGFTQLVADSFSVMDPDLEVTASRGKAFDPNDKRIEEIRTLSEVALTSDIIEENALALYNDRQEPILVKGVSDNYEQMTNMESLLMNGDFTLHSGDVDFCVAGVGVAMKLGLRADNITPMEIYSPKRDVKVNMANPSSAFTRAYTYPSGIFSLGQVKYDDQVVIVSLDLARELFRYDTEITTLNIKLKDPSRVDKAEQKIQAILGADFVVKNRFEQQSEMFRMVNVEKWVTYFILIFILTIAAFNLVGSLSMLILDKSADIDILRNMGANNKLICKIFLIEGWLISFSGAVIGLLLGIILCLIQIHFGILKLGQTPGAFIIDNYPVAIQVSDIIFIFLTVSIIGFLIVLYPINVLRKRLKLTI